MTESNKNIDDTSKATKKKIPVTTILIILLVVGVLIAFVGPKVFKRPTKQEVLTVSTLEKVVKSSTLSTYETVYNGVAVAMNADKPDKTDYYVSYTATVKAGLDFNKIEISKDDETQRIIIHLPEITLQEPNVKIEEMDFIIVNQKIKQDGLSADAYKRCLDDVKAESEKQEAIYKYAQQNAENLIKGLISPFVNQLDGDYSIVFE